jgi:SAM-dependent methyltransferase
MAVEPRSREGMPAPPELLIARVTGQTDVAAFHASGLESVGDLERTLAVVGRSLESFGSILDFGCGCGRMLLWLEAVGARGGLYGTDVDEDAVAWAAEHIPYSRCSVNDADPPLEYPDDSFDLIFSQSVFTHIDERHQDAWLAELARVSRPGGLLVLSVHGEWALGDRWSEAHVRLEDSGHLFLPDMRPEPELGHPSWYASTYHAPWYVFERWAKWFAIRAYVPKAANSFQDHVLLENTAELDRVLPLSARPRRAASPPPAPSAPSAVPPIAAEQGVRAALVQIGRGRSRFGPLGAALRGAILRLMRPYTAHQAAADIALAKSVDDLARAGEAQARRIEALEQRTGAVGDAGQ